MIKAVDFQTNGIMYINEKEVEDAICYMVLELAENGEIFDLIYETGPL